MERDLSIAKGISLDAIGNRLGLDQSSLRHDYLSQYEMEIAHIRTLERPDVCILSGHDTVRTVSALAHYFTDAVIHVFHCGSQRAEVDAFFADNKLAHVTLEARADVDAVEEAVKRMPNPQLFLEDGTHKWGSKVAYFVRIFPYLRDGGRYIAEDLHTCFIENYRDENGQSLNDWIGRHIHYMSAPNAELAKLDERERVIFACLKRLVTGRKFLVAEKSGAILYKCRNEEFTSLARARFGNDVLDEAVGFAATDVTAKSAVWTNRADFEGRFPAKTRVPDLYWRTLRNVRCAPGQVAVKASVLIPDSFRRNALRKLENRHLLHYSSTFAWPRASFDAPLDCLAGAYLYLDSEYPGHFGHTVLEVLARLWAWERARERHPNCKVLISGEGGSAPEFVYDLLAAFGIARTDIVVIQGVVEVECLITGTPLYNVGLYAHPALLETWNRIKGNLYDVANGPDIEKIFVSRDASMKRGCLNQAEVEAAFCKAGFVVVRPETMSVRQQATCFANAKVIAGFAGSAMLNGIFSERCQQKIVIGSETFDSRNDYLISMLKGEPLAYFWCPAVKQHPPGGWTVAAFMSDYHFDFARDGDKLAQLLSWH